jgi:hypothetical protein
MSKKSIHLTYLVVAFGLILASTANAAPIGTSFTYQGRLIDANNPADGLYDLQFNTTAQSKLKKSRSLCR